MGWSGDACIVGIAERPSERKFHGTPTLTIEQWAGLAADALADAGIDPAAVDGLVCAGDVAEASLFLPATIAEYCGWSVNFAERVDLGGASAVGMVWRAAAAIELGICEVVVCATVGRPRPPSPATRGPNPRAVFGASSMEWGSPQAEFDVPYGNVAQNCGYAMYAQRYHELYGWDERATRQDRVRPARERLRQPGRRLLRAADHRRRRARVARDRDAAPPARDRDAVHRRRRVRGDHAERGRATAPTGRSTSPASVSASRTRRRRTRPRCPAHRCATRPCRAFGMAGLAPADVDMVQLYDCYTITVLLTIEDSGFCGKGEGLAFVNGHDLSYRGDFPCNTHGGQLGMGQTGMSGGMSHVLEGVRQIQGRAGERQVSRHDTAYVSGTGGVMSEQGALVLVGG